MSDRDPRQAELFPSRPRRTPSAVTAGHPPSQASSDTSAIAADMIVAISAKRNARVLAYVVGRDLKGATQDEAAEFFAIGRPTMCCRFWELERVGLIGKGDKSDTRLTRSGRPSQVYYATKTGIARCERAT